MNIFIQSNLWVEYFNSKKKVTLNDSEQLLQQIIQNKSNNFVYNYNWEKVYSSDFANVKSDEFDYNDLFNQVILDLNNHDRLLNSPTPAELKTESEVIEQLERDLTTNFLLFKSCSISKIGLAIFDQIDKPNQHWINFNLCAFNGKDGISLSYDSFNSNDQISSFFANVLSQRWNSNSRIYVKTDYLNFGAPFSNIKEKKITICTTSYINGQRKKSSAIQAERNNIQTQLNNNCSLKTSATRPVLHERMIICEGLIIKVDHDFEQVCCSNQNWMIIFNHNIERYSDLINSINQNYQ